MLYELVVYTAKIPVWSDSIDHPVNCFISSVTNNCFYWIEWDFPSLILS